MFFDNGHWGKTQYLLERGLDTELRRRNVIANNIANVDVPHFKRSQVSFEAQMRRAVDSKKYARENKVPTKLTNTKHIPFFRAMDYKQVKVKTHVDYLSTMRNDGNNVDVEHEMTLSLKNQLRYQALADHVSQNFKTMNIVLRSI